MKRFLPYLSLPLFLIACASDDTTDDMYTGSGGGSDVLGSGGMSTTASGGSSSGGATTSTGGGSGMSTGGNGMSTGGNGMSTGGNGMSTGGNGMSTGGGDMGTGGGMSGGPDPVPSAGCGKANPKTGAPNDTLEAGKKYYVKLPTNYDENKPYRVLFFFNPTGGGNDIGWAERSAGYESLSAKDTAIRVYPHESMDPSQGSSNGWSPDDIGSFGPLYDAVVNNFCVDTTRVFAAGESSGGEMSAFLGCEYGDKLRGIAPGAPKNHGSWNLDQKKSTCKGNPTAIVIWSDMDNVLQQPTGPDFRDFYRDINMCDNSSTPVEGFTDNKSNCKMFDGCMEGSDTYFCQHSDPTYGNPPSYHGWAAFAAKMTWGVFEKL